MTRAADIEQAKTELRELGFTKLEAGVPLLEIRCAESMLDAVVERARSSASEHSWRLALSKTAASEPSHPEVVRPALLNKALQRTVLFERCQHLATQLLGRRAYYLFDHAIYKQAWSDTGVHWHQDQAYLGPEIPVRAVHFWIPFQDVDGPSGCLRFVPLSRAGALLPHSSAYEAHPHILRADIAEPDSFVEQPLKLGYVGVHTNFTLHSSGRNRTGHVRKAWIIHFGDRPRWYKHVLRAGARLSMRAQPS